MRTKKYTSIYVRSRNSHADTLKIKINKAEFYRYANLKLQLTECTLFFPTKLFKTSISCGRLTCASVDTTTTAEYFEKRARKWTSNKHTEWGKQKSRTASHRVKCSNVFTSSSKCAIMCYINFETGIGLYFSSFVSLTKYKHSEFIFSLFSLNFG